MTSGGELATALRHPEADAMPVTPAEERLRAAFVELTEAVIELAHEPTSSSERTAAELLSPREFARRSSLSRTSVYELIGEGRLRSARVRGRRLIPSSELARLIGGQRS
jgi:excisionase family DNA binding protein